MQRIPKSTLKRLAIYHRCFIDLKKEGELKVQSRELSKILGFEPATIRKDFSYLGELGRQGYGYKIDFVLAAFERVLNIQEAQNCVLVGAGNLGKAVMNFFTSERFNSEFSAPTKLVAAFDTNPKTVGTQVNNVKVLHASKLVDYIKKNQIKYVVLAVPSEFAQSTVDKLADLGIEGILNLTSSIINAEEIVVHEVDLAIELETLVFTAIQEQVAKKQTTIKDVLDL